MFHIALCDDEAAQRQLTHKLLDRYFSDQGAAVKIWEFSDGQSLLNAMLDETFDLYLLDIVMPEVDGINLGLALRKSDENGVIIKALGKVKAAENPAMIITVSTE